MTTENNLNISKSNKFRWVYSKADINLVNNIMAWAGISRPIAEIISKKGISSKEELNNYLNLPLTAILNPFELINMDKAADRLATAVINREKICIYGDYDVDGISSTSLLYIFLKSLSQNIIYYIPNRLEEGYGLNSEAIKEIASNKVNLIVTVDCGIGADKEVELASSLGIDVIVTDHHRPADNIPKKAYAIINPMLEEDTYPFKGLAGVGVAFKLVMALRFKLRERNYFKDEVPNIKSLLDIVTLGTVADVMPLTHENRIFVKHGLDILSSSNNRLGIRELKNVIGIIQNEQIKTSHVGFMIAPRINAVGRMGSSDRSLKLLVTDDIKEAKTLATELDNENKYRQSIEREILKETFDKIDENSLAEKRRGLVLYSKEWHPGVVGIVASRVVDKYFRPTLVLTSDGACYKGSARSIPRFHLYNGLQDISDCLLSFGGHKYAAGVKVDYDKINELEERFDDIVKKTLSDEDFIPEINIDAYLEAKDINISLIEDLSMLEPYGAGNKEPVFAMSKVRKNNQEEFVGKDSSHLKCIFEKDGIYFESIGYNMKDCKGIVSDSDYFDIVFTVSLNRYKGNDYIQLIIKDIKKHGSIL